MKTGFLRAFLLAHAIALGSTAVHSAVVVNNAPNQDYGTNMSFALVADDFTLAGAYDITGLRFWTLQSSASDYSGSVYWAIYSDASGPASLVTSGNAAVSAVATGTASAFGYAEYRFDIPVSFQLAAGTYWLALQNGPLGNTDSKEILWESSDTGGALGQYKDFQLSATPDWLVDSFNHAFAILGDPVGPPNPTPEPGSLVLLAGGLLALRVIRRQRQPA